MSDGRMSEDLTYEQENQIIEKDEYKCEECNQVWDDPDQADKCCKEVVEENR